MLVNGKWLENITCPKCKYRHPKELSCMDAAAIAKAGRPKVSKCFAQLRQDYHFPGGHLFEHLTPHVPYEVVRRHAEYRIVVDDEGKEIWISTTALRKYFYLTKKEEEDA